MASGALSMHQTRLSVEGKIKVLINNDLKEICRGEGLAVSGVKAQLQSRILERKCYSDCSSLLLLPFLPLTQPAPLRLKM